MCHLFFQNVEPQDCCSDIQFGPRNKNTRSIYLNQEIIEDGQRYTF